MQCSCVDCSQWHADISFYALKEHSVLPLSVCLSETYSENLTRFFTGSLVFINTICLQINSPFHKVYLISSYTVLVFTFYQKILCFHEPFGEPFGESF